MIKKPSETQIQAGFVKVLMHYTGFYPQLKSLFSIPNEGKRSKWEGAKLKRMGLNAGIPDLFLPLPLHGWHGLFIEHKKHDGRVSKDQKFHKENLRAAGYAVCISRSVDQSVSIFKDYTNGVLDEKAHDK